MATDQVLESSSVPHGRLLKLDVNKCVNINLILKSVCTLGAVAYTVLLAEGVPSFLISDKK